MLVLVQYTRKAVYERFNVVGVGWLNQGMSTKDSHSLCRYVRLGGSCLGGLIMLVCVN